MAEQAGSLLMKPHPRQPVLPALLSPKPANMAPARETFQLAAYTFHAVSHALGTLEVPTWGLVQPPPPSSPSPCQPLPPRWLDTWGMLPQVAALMSLSHSKQARALQPGVGPEKTGPGRILPTFYLFSYFNQTLGGSGCYPDLGWNYTVGLERQVSISGLLHTPCEISHPHSPHFSPVVTS